MTESAKSADPVTPSEQRRKRTGPSRLKLPRGVLLRVDVLHDGKGRLDTDTRERLTPGWSDERNAVAATLLRTVVEVLEGFPEDGEDSGPRSPKNARVPNSKANADLLRLYG